MKVNTLMNRYLPSHPVIWSKVGAAAEGWRGGDAAAARAHVEIAMRTVYVGQCCGVDT